MSSDPRSDALAALSQFLVADVSVDDTLHRVAEITAIALPEADMAGISMVDDRGRLGTRIFTDPRCPRIDEAQYESGTGPCIDAWRLKRIVRVDDMAAAEPTYPSFSQAAREHGVMSTLSLPLIARDEGIGALNLYAAGDQAFSGDDEDLGLELAAAAAVVLANARAYRRAVELGHGLREAMRSRAVIEQAKGVLMAQSAGLSPDDAFETLRQASQRENIKLREIAQRVVDRRGRPAEEG